MTDEEKFEMNMMTDEEADKVSGGFSLLYSFDEGDCFKKERLLIRVMNSYTNVPWNTDIICRFQLPSGRVEEKMCSAQSGYLSKENYVGRYVYDF